MARDDPQINLRIPLELKERLDAASTQKRRSLTAEVVARLEASFSTGGEDGGVHIDDRTLDLFAEHIAEKVVGALDKREKPKRQPRTRD
ncbi:MULTISPECIES: Arc family DNA-binding protein [Burkholderia]|uniref:Arc family DNA-binding protein n=1 Tax=Burkholderia TaxID=32008 RepID=UPI0005CEBD17|nr:MULTISPECIES: Arc family DNA-binding protein [Burkholderia]MBJ9925928.1 Arc family DNA-binding protein [Burkholderia cenocepacia]MCW5144307.1 Arc family DNA-binding protein [Burkholderia cenocepacia]MDN7733265.1 Arc family DNA-binding protein [Burkholderia orbicola]TGN96928.1 Arc family DNA-binding protein [Burkholderia sp. USMB20]